MAAGSSVSGPAGAAEADGDADDAGVPMSLTVAAEGAGLLEAGVVDLATSCRAEPTGRD
jgi:hypothetical protein